VKIERECEANTQRFPDIYRIYEFLLQNVKECTAKIRLLKISMPLGWFDRRTYGKNGKPIMTKAIPNA